MPLPTDPNKPEFFVYRFEVDQYPFYVGIGRAERASDRIRYVRSLFTPKNTQKLARSEPQRSCHGCIYTARTRTRAEAHLRDPIRAKALELERGEIKRLLDAGYVLANRQQNPYWRERDEDGIVAAILSGESVERQVQLLRIVNRSAPLDRPRKDLEQ